jgi:hypothetical protein
MTKEEKRKRGMFFPARQQKRQKLRMLKKVALKRHFEPTMTPVTNELPLKDQRHDLKSSMYRVRDKNKKPKPGEPALIGNVDIVYNRKTRRRLAAQLAKGSLK